MLSHGVYHKARSKSTVQPAVSVCARTRRREGARKGRRDDGTRRKRREISGGAARGRLRAHGGERWETIIEMQ